MCICPEGLIMKRNLLTIVVCLLCSQLVLAQPSYAELKLRDKTLNEGISYIQQGEYDLAASRVASCLELDSTFARAWLLKGQLLMEWGIPEDALAALKKARYYDPDLGEA